MKRKQSQTNLSLKFEKFTKIYIGFSMTLASILTICSIIVIVIDTECLLDNKEKYNKIVLSKNDGVNNLKRINDIKICFNSSNPASYESLIQQLDELFEKNYCYKNINNFEMKCNETYHESRFHHNFSVNASQISDFQNYCLNNKYGYRNSQPCIVFIYFFEGQVFYKFPISVSIKENFYKQIECSLIHRKNETLIKYKVKISNGNCY